VLLRKYVALSVDIEKAKNKTNNLRSHFNKPEKDEKIKLKSRR
jgi:hypothetical protein